MNDEQLLRYSRHIMLPQMDIDGQEKLLAAHVLVVGLGGLGGNGLNCLHNNAIGNPSGRLFAHQGVDHALIGLLFIGVTGSSHHRRISRA